jgi:hypothetical protein
MARGHVAISYGLLALAASIICFAVFDQYNPGFDLKTLLILLAIPLAAIALTGPQGNWAAVMRDITQPMCSALVLIGITQMLVNLSDPAMLGPAYAVALLPPLYGLAFVGIASAYLAEEVTPDYSPLRKLAALSIIWAALLFTIFHREGAEIFLNLFGLLFMFGGVLLFYALDQLRSGSPEGAWGDRLLGLGAIAFIYGTSLMLREIDDPKSVGPAMAMALLTLIYALVIIVSCRILVPRSVTKPAIGGAGFTFLNTSLPILFGCLIHALILIISMQEI